MQSKPPEWLKGKIWREVSPEDMTKAVESFIADFDEFRSRDRAERRRMMRKSGLANELLSLSSEEWEETKQRWRSEAVEGKFPLPPPS